MKSHVLYAALLAASALSACGSNSPPPASPAAVPAAAATPAAPEPAPQAAPAVVTPAPSPAPAPAAPGQSAPQESFATKAATAAIPADAIGGSPVANVADAWVRGHEALKKYCGDNAMPCDSFYVKESPQETSGYYTMQFFGAPNNDPMYIGVRIYPDGRAEVIR